MHSDIYEKQNDFQYIYDFSKCCQGNSFHKIYLIQNIYSSEQLEASSQAEKNNNYIYISIYGFTTLNKPKSRQVYTNYGIITQNIFSAAVSTSVELKTNTRKLY